MCNAFGVAVHFIFREANEIVDFLAKLVVVFFFFSFFFIGFGIPYRGSSGSFLRFFSPVQALLCCYFFFPFNMFTINVEKKAF